MIRLIPIAFFVIIIFSGCSAKKINENVESITSDISTLFEETKEKPKDQK
nr:hypothetical protein [uncultured Sulfurimonas sp.]